MKPGVNSWAERQAGRTSPGLSCGQLVPGVPAVILQISPKIQRNTGRGFESHVFWHVLVLACCRLLLKGQGMCGIQLSMSVWGLKNKVTWGSQETPPFEMMAVAIIVHSSAILIASYQITGSGVRWQTDKASPAVKCRPMVMQSSKSLVTFEGVTSGICLT